MVGITTGAKDFDRRATSHGRTEIRIVVKEFHGAALTSDANYCLYLSVSSLSNTI